MFWNKGLSHYLAHLIIQEWEKSQMVEWKSHLGQIVSHIHLIINEDLNKEKELDQEVSVLLDELDKTHAGQFERYKMYPLLKKKLAKKKGIIL